MQFLVIVGAAEPIDLSKLEDRPERANRYRDELVARGTIVHHAHIAGHRAHMWIFEVDGVDELDRVIAEDPMAPFMSGSPQVIPLVSPDRMREREAAMR
jgi:muconolactone delta-isomerase